MRYYMAAYCRKASVLNKHGVEVEVWNNAGNDVESIAMATKLVRELGKLDATLHNKEVAQLYESLLADKYEEPDL